MFIKKFDLSNVYFQPWPTVEKTRMKENRENASEGKHWLFSFIPKVYFVKSEQICAVYN